MAKVTTKAVAATAKAESKPKNNPFQDTIKAYLDDLAKKDKLFAKTYAKKNKTIEKCCAYIISEAKKRQFSSNMGSMAAIPDDEVYGMAIHYYDEDNLDIDKASDAEVKTVVNSARVSGHATKAAATVKKAKAVTKKKDDAEVEIPDFSIDLF